MVILILVVGLGYCGSALSLECRKEGAGEWCHFATLDNGYKVWFQFDNMRFSKESVTVIIRVDHKGSMAIILVKDGDVWVGAPLTFDRDQQRPPHPVEKGSIEYIFLKTLKTAYPELNFKPW